VPIPTAIDRVCHRLGRVGWVSTRGRVSAGGRIVRLRAGIAERYRGEISVGTLRNWRSMRVGPGFVKIGKAVLYPVAELDAWDEQNRVACRASKRNRRI
jgi:hypothetical protein